MLVKKYGNRRLYDTDKSSYVRLDEIAERIRAGADVRVVDAKTDADLTAVTLAQIIFEDRNAARLLPVPLLLQLIRMGDEPLAEFLGKYVSWALELYMQTRAGLSNIYNPLAMLRGFVAPPTAPAAPAESSDDIKALRRELAEIRSSLSARKPRKPRRRG